MASFLASKSLCFSAAVGFWTSIVPGSMDGLLMEWSEGKAIQRIMHIAAVTEDRPTNTFSIAAYPLREVINVLSVLFWTFGFWGED